MSSEGFGTWLGAQMSRCGFASNVDLEHATGIGNTTISRWRTGAMAPSVDQLRKLEKPLRTPLIELLVRAGVITADEAKLPRGQLRTPEPVAVDAAHAIRQDRDLTDRARRHLLDQYDMLRELSQAAHTKESDRPLRAVARKRPPRTP